MAETLHVLIVEDSEDDTLLLLQELRRGRWVVSYERVDTAAEMTAALDTHAWDLIIADYSMPQFSGPAALKLAIQRKSDLPFILVSGVVGEEAAVEAMKAGADDYLSKGNLSRLLPAVERELRKAAERRATQRLEQELRKREARLADALQLAGVGTWHLNMATRTAVWSDKAYRIMGFKTDPTPPAFKEMLERLYPMDRALLAGLFRNPATRQFALDCQLLRADGATQFIQIRGDIIRDKNSVPLEAAGMLQDITVRKRAEDALRKSEAQLQTIVESLDEGVVVADLSGNLLHYNRAALEVHGYANLVDCRRHLSDLTDTFEFSNMDGSVLPLEQWPASRVLRGEKLHDVEVRIRQIHAGWERIVSYGGMLVHDPAGQPLMAVVTISDISERKQAELDLAHAKEAADAANRTKSEFLANMSHEIRTPMTAIVGFAEMLMNKSAEECEKVGCVQIIRRNAAHLLELINEILDLSKIEAGQMTVERISCNLPALLSDIISLMRPRAEEKGLGFEVTFSGAIPVLIQTDPLRLRQILVNLLGNAMKFTKAGGIDVRIRDEGRGGPDILLCVDVIDTGIGMPPEVLERLFRPFTQGDESITRKFGGTGLGLTISQRFAKLLDGNISVKSNVGVGSTFTLRINGGASAGVELLQGLTEATLPAQVDQKVQADLRIHGRVLLVEDGRDNQRLLRMYLTDAGAEVVSAENGKIAIELATAQPFDLILMDMQMPVMDGYAATADLRRRGLKIPIIALTAYAMAEDRAKCMASGCTDYLSKPVQEEQLVKTVNRHLGSDHSSAAGQASAPPATAPKATVANAGSGVLKSSFEGNERMMKVVAEFVEGLPGEVRKMSDLLNQKDLDALRRVVHQLLGACGGYGFDPVSDPARRAEEAIKAAKPLDAIKPLIDTLIAVIRRIDGYEENKLTSIAA